MKRSFFLVFLGLAFSCAGVPSKKSAEDYQRAFNEFQTKNPDQIWSPNITARTKQAISSYLKHEKTDSGKEYGESVRTLKLRNKSADDIQALMESKKCNKKEEVLRNPDTQAPLLDLSGKQIPMNTYICPDGGVVRVKPFGDSTSKFRPQPHALKALRYPFNAPYSTFDDEVLKVDDEGNPIPKWKKDLNQVYDDPQKQREFIEGWAEDAHMDLKQSKN